MSLRDRLVSLRDRSLLKLRPRYLSGAGATTGIAGLGVGLVDPTLAPVALGVPAAIAAASIAYWKRRPSEYQLRHRLRDDILVLPLKSTNDGFVRPGQQREDRYGEPPGSTRAVEFEMDRSMLVLGESGSGKTEAMQLLAHQMQTDPEDALVAFEYKKEYQEFLADEETIRLSSLNTDVSWNIFKEIRHAEDAMEMAKAIFTTSDNDYFSNAASEVLRDVFLLMLKRGVIDDYQPTNKDLVDFVSETDLGDLREALEDGSYSSTKHLVDDAEASSNIHSNLESQVSQTFVGDFAGEGDFSVREYMKNPDGRKLILDYPVDQSAAVKPIFRLLIDWSIRFGLLSDRGSYYLLDEFAALPPLSMIERLVNAGRSSETYAIAGVQDISQIRATYGRDQADSLLSGFAQEIHLRVDQSSVGYVRKKLGKQRVVREQSNGEYAAFEEHRVSESEVQNLSAGQGTIHTPTGWQRGRLYMLEEVADELLPSVEETHPVPVEEPADESALVEDSIDEQPVDDEQSPPPDAPVTTDGGVDEDSDLCDNSEASHDV